MLDMMTLIYRVQYGGRKGRSAARRLLRNRAAYPTDVAESEGEEVMIPREAFIQALPFAWLFRRAEKARPASSPVTADSAPHLHAAIVAIAALHADAESRKDTQAMRAYAQALRCLLLPTRKFLRDADDLAPQPEWPL